MKNTEYLLSTFKTDWQKIVEKGKNIITKLQLSTNQADGTSSDLNVTLKELYEGEFTIAVCGQVKTGKSTFLNSLLFGNNVLPSFDTPETAKLTYLKYTDGQEHFVADFYNKDEWAAIKTRLSEMDARKDLEKRCRYSAEKHGVNEQKYVLNVARTSEKITDLSRLKDYVSVPKDEDDDTSSEKDKTSGKYTPYVKSVTIFLKNDMLKGIRIVDTPGLNDSIIDSGETSRWIQQAHAIIYLLQPKGPDANDMQFFNAYFPSADAESRVFILNHIDELENGYEEILSYVKGLGVEKEYQDRKLFGSKEIICPYSALIKLIQQKQSAVLPLSEDELFYLNKVSKDFDPDPMKINSIIQQKLHNNEGRTRIKGAIRLLTSVFESNLNEFKRQISVIEDAIETNKCNQEKIQKEIEKYRTIAGGAQKIYKESLDKADRELEEQKNDYNESLIEIKIRIKNLITDKIQQMDKSNIQRLLSWSAQDILEKELYKWKSLQMATISKIQKKLLNEAKANLIKFQHSSGIKIEIVGEYLQYSDSDVKTLCDDLNLRKEINTSVSELYTFFSCRDSKAKKDQIIGKCFEKIEEVFGYSGFNFKQFAERPAKTAIQDMFKSFLKTISEMNDSKVEALKRSVEEKEASIKLKENELKRMKSKVSEVLQGKNEFDLLSKYITEIA